MDNDRLYEALQEIRQDVAVIKTQFDQLKDLAPKVENYGAKIIAMEEQIKQLQSTNSKMWGVISGITVGVIVAIVKTFFGI